MFFRLVRSVELRKILSPHEESNLRPSDSAFRCSSTEPQRLHSERGPLRSSYDTRPMPYHALRHRVSTMSDVYYEVHMARVLHTARISNVESVMFVDRNKRDGRF